jgi:hypothetical protein
MTVSERTCGQLELGRGKLWWWLDGDRAAGDGEEWREGYSGGRERQGRTPGASGQVEEARSATKWGRG